MRRRKAFDITGREVISLDFGHHTSKVVVGKADKSTIYVEKTFSFPTPANSLVKGVVVDGALLAATLREVLIDQKVRTSLAAVCMESPEVVNREFSIPSTSEDQLEKIVAFEAQQHLPVEVGQHVVQSRALGTIVEGGVKKTRFLATAIPTTTVRSYYSMLQSAGLKGIVMDTTANSVCKLIERGILLGDNAGTRTGVVAVVDIGFNNTSIMVFDGVQFRLNRLLGVGSETIDRNLMSYLGVTRQELAAIKQEEVDLSLASSDAEIANDRSKHIRSVFERVLDGWAQEVDRILRFLGTRNETGAVDAVYLYGGTALTPGICAYLQESIGVRFELLPALSGIRTKPGQVTDTSSYVNAIGTLIRR